MASRYTISVRTNGQTAALKNGDVGVLDANLDFIEVVPQLAAFRRMLRGMEFDICELASTTYFVARNHGKKFKAIPIFFGRQFHHSGILVRKDAGITAPRDLEGRDVGVRAYSVTTGVWTRGILQDEFGLDSSRVRWHINDEEHVEELALPANVVRCPPGTSLADKMERGELIAAFSGNAGLGQNADVSGYTDLVPGAAALEQQWYSRTGILPFHGTIVIKDEVVEQNPDLPRQLYDAFVQSRNSYLQRLRTSGAETAEDRKMLEMMALTNGHPLPYGLVANRNAVHALCRYAVQQSLIAPDTNVDDLFYAFD
jgi:4,5-dihydroxyphthalate decarboxylase